MWLEINVYWNERLKIVWISYCCSSVDCLIILILASFAQVGQIGISLFEVSVLYSNSNVLYTWLKV